MALLWLNPVAFGLAALILTSLVLWLISQEHARCSICGLAQWRTVYSRYVCKLVARNWACVKCRRNIGWWGRERIPVRVTPR